MPGRGLGRRREGGGAEEEGGWGRVGSSLSKRRSFLVFSCIILRGSRNLAVSSSLKSEDEAKCGPGAYMTVRGREVERRGRDERDGLGWWVWVRCRCRGGGLGELMDSGVCIFSPPWASTAVRLGWWRDLVPGLCDGIPGWEREGGGGGGKQRRL